MNQLKSADKSYDIPKWDVWNAWLKVKSNQGGPGVDGQSLEEFEADLQDNLYVIWNRMNSGSYFPPPVLAVEIPKEHGRGTRMLGVPTVGDRVAQTVVAKYLEGIVEPVFHPDSFGYRPNRSALDAVDKCCSRCWRYDWVIDLDIQKFFDSVPWHFILKAVMAHTTEPWVLLYVKRWLAAPIQAKDGSLLARFCGTPQGSAISPILANLFMHYAFDVWLNRAFPTVVFERYADDAVVHCDSLEQAEAVLAALHDRMAEVGLNLHPEKTKIVYCKDDRRRVDYPTRSFVFLGFGFRARTARRKGGGLYALFLPAISNDALLKVNDKVRSWRIHRRTNRTASEIAREINPVIRGWMSYYGAFNRSALYSLFYRINSYLYRWVMKKLKNLNTWKAAYKELWAAYKVKPNYFAHWSWVRPTVSGPER